MLDANSIGDHMTAKLSNSIALDSAKAEAVTAKAEWIEYLLQLGTPVEGHDLESIIETVLDSDGIKEALKIAYLYGNPQSINVLVDAEITRLANAIAPDLVQAHLDSMEDAA